MTEFSYAISTDAHGDHGVTIQNLDVGAGGDSFIRAQPLANILFSFDDPGAIIRISTGACCGEFGCISDGINEAECAALGGLFNEGTDCANPATCACSNDGQCDDGDACNGGDTCNVDGHFCQTGTPLNCD